VVKKIGQFIRAHWLSLLVVIIINTIVLTNTIIHHPKIGYDVTDHLTYAQIFPYRFPTLQDTREYFSAPLAYFLPSLYDKVCVYYQWNDCRGLDGRFWQILNFFISIVITTIIWKIAERLKPGNELFKVSMLSMLAILTVYYRTFSQARSEPYVALFMILTIAIILKQLQNLESINWKDGIQLGIVLGLLILSRQWGFFVFPAIGLLVILVYIKEKNPACALAGYSLSAWQLLLSLAVGFISICILHMELLLHLTRHPKAFLSRTRRQFFIPEVA
jgi:hypothetical protein